MYPAVHGDEIVKLKVWYVKTNHGNTIRKKKAR